MNAITASGTAVGVYSSHYEWGKTVGLGCAAAFALPLWYAHYDSSASCDDYPAKYPFGNWTKAFAKQFGDAPAKSSGISDCIKGKVAADVDVLC